MSSTATVIDGQQIEPIPGEALELVGQARTVRITDQASYDMTCGLLRTAVGIRNTVFEKFDAPRAAAWKAYQATLKLLKEAIDPIDAAITQLKQGIAGWEEACRKEEEELRAEEERQLASEYAAESIEVPVFVPEKTVYQRAKGTSVSYRYAAEVTDLKALCMAVAEGKISAEVAVQPNTAGLNRLAAAQRELFRVPGCRAVKKPIVSQRIGA